MATSPFRVRVSRSQNCQYSRALGSFRGTSCETRHSGARRTLGEVAGWCQLGELRLFSMGEISARARGIGADILVGEPLGVVLVMRRGCTCVSPENQHTVGGVCSHSRCIVGRRDLPIQMPWQAKFARRQSKPDANASECEIYDSVRTEETMPRDCS